MEVNVTRQEKIQTEKINFSAFAKGTTSVKSAKLVTNHPSSEAKPVLVPKKSSLQNASKVTPVKVAEEAPRFVSLVKPAISVKPVLVASVDANRDCNAY